MHEMELLENAVLLKLEPLKTDFGLRTLEAWPGRRDETDDLTRMTRRFPAVYVLVDLLGRRPRNSYDLLSFGFMILVAAAHARGAEFGARGDGINAGAYDILEGARNLLHRRNLELGPATVPFFCAEEAALDVRPARRICAWTAVYEGQAQIPVNP